MQVNTGLNGQQPVRDSGGTQYFAVPCNLGTTTNNTYLQLSSTTNPIPVDNPVLNLFMGAVLFYTVFYFMVWFFRRRK